MNRKPKTPTLTKIVFCFATLLVAMHSLSSHSLADGKLGRARSAARKSKPEPQRESRPEPRRQRDPEPESSSSDNDSNSRSGGKLNGVRSAVRSNSRPNSGPRPNHSHNSNNNRDNRRRRNNHRRDSRAGGLIVINQPPVCDPVFVPVVAHPRNDFFLPAPVIPVEPYISPVVEPAPVVAPSVIQHVPVAPAVVETIEPVESYDWFQSQTSRVWATIGSDFDGLTTGAIGFQFQCPESLGLEGSVMTLRESGYSFRDHLWLGDVNVVYEFLSSQDVRGRIGIEVNWLGDSWGGEAGLNLTAGVDLRLTERLVLSGEADAGTLGDADFFHGRVSLARRFDACELILGADHFNIGGAEY